MNTTQKAKLSAILIPLICFLPVLTQNEYVFMSEFYGWVLYFILTIGSLAGFSYYIFYVYNSKEKYLIPFGILIGMYVIAGIFVSLMLPVGFAVGLLSYVTGIFLLPAFFAIPVKHGNGSIIQKIGVIVTSVSVFFVILFFMRLLENNSDSQITGIIMMTEIGFLALSGILFMLLGANHADAKEVSPRPEKSIDEEKLRKRNKAVSLAAAIILVALLFFGVMFTFAEPNTWLSSHPTGYTTDNPPPENIGIYIVTEKDFTATPVLRKLVDRWSASIPITDDPIVKIKNPHALSGAEAYAITEKYGNGYLLYEGIYYSFGIVVS